MQWQTAPELDIDFAISLRIHNAEGEWVYQEDIVLLNPKHVRTSHWAEDELVDNLYHIELPADLVNGENELRLVVYDFESLKPTVELGVWEPEVVLATLQVAEGR